MKTRASLPRKLLTRAMFKGQFSRDWTTERHSSEVISTEYILVKNCISGEETPISQGLSVGDEQGRPVSRGLSGMGL